LKFLVTGSQGMLGKDLVPFLADSHEVHGIDIQDLDLRDFEAVRTMLRSVTPQVVVHCAAMTNVDGCEKDPDQAYSVNALATRNVALASAEAGSSLVFISTDFVFDGAKPGPYNEFDTPNPVSVYGRSKYAGEIYVRQFCPHGYILRTAWLYGRHAWNFVDWVISTARDKGRLSIVTDQRGSPTYTVDLCKQIQTVAASGRFGLYHAVGLGGVSRFDWTRKALEFAGLSGIELKEIASADLRQIARRPENSCLDPMALRLEGLCVMRPWEEALEEYVKNKE